MKYSIEQIKNMTDEQWNDFRNESWNTKRIAASQAVPVWYLKDRSAYITFLRTQKEKNESSGRPFNINIDEIENYNSEQWESYRELSWNKKNKIYASIEIPDWFLKNKEEYVNFLEKHLK
ncbi:MAG: hypothetical protein LBB95_02375 [Mycoplasmataceae bacterium]|jgi:hypothetical protein|nr:hypothetical protein [Mycoplasmataceae bacterium]